MGQKKEKIQLCLTYMLSGIASGLISSACETLLTRYPNLTPRLLDNVIWNYERARQ
jgi:hypothetical protein